MGGGEESSIKMVICTWKSWLGIPVLRKEGSSHNRSSRRWTDCLKVTAHANGLHRYLKSPVAKGPKVPDYLQRDRRYRPLVPRQ